MFDAIDKIEQLDMARSLFGVLPQTMTLEQANEERLDRI